MIGIGLKEVYKKKNYILVESTPPLTESDAEYGIESMLRMAHDLRRLNGGKAITIKIGDDITVTLKQQVHTLNSDIDKEETV